MGHGHSSDSSGKSAAESNQIVLKKLNEDLDQYSSAYGMTLTPEQRTELLNKIWPTSSRFDERQGERVAAYDQTRNDAYAKARDFIQPNLYNLKTNPAVAPDQTSVAANTLKTVLGRDATPDEAAYFAKELAQGKTAYELQQELMSLPEYQRIQAGKDREALGAELLGQQQQAFEKATPSIISSFMKSGRLGSSGLNSALAKAQQELEQQRQGYLGQVGYADVSGIRNQAYNAFQNYNAPFQQTYNPANIFGQQMTFGQQNLQRQQQIDDYTRQQNDYNNYLLQSRPRGQIGRTAGTIIGGVLGSYGGPAGAAAGAQAGGAIGGLFKN